MTTGEMPEVSFELLLLGKRRCFRSASAHVACYNVITAVAAARQRNGDH